MRTFVQKHNQRQERISPSPARSNVAKHRLDHREDPILRLQRAIGNQAAQRMLQTDAEESEFGLTGTTSPRFGHDFSGIPIRPPAAGAMQTKLAINKAGDEYELEADRVAEQVMRMPEPQLQRACPCGGGFRKGQTEQPGQEQKSLQTGRIHSSDSGQTALSLIVHEVLRSPGQPLDPAARGFMESRFGQDFSRIRLHTDPPAGRSTEVLGADAYTFGTHKPSPSATAPAIQRDCSTRSHFSDEEHGPGMGKAPFGQSCDSAPTTGREEEEEEEPALAMRKSEPGAAPAPTSHWAQGLSQTKGGGHPLSPEARSFFEPRLGHEFGDVRVHRDEHASNLVRELGAEAFTNGADIYFKSGRYDPESPSGIRLLAHELTHVVQQNALGTGDRIQRYRLKGFPAAEEAKMHAAIPTAISKVKSCSKLSWWGKYIIPPALRRMRYDYVPDLGLCGWTFPASWYIEVGPDAFKQNVCCDLESTLAHEAAHTEWYTEGRARAMECNCFGCSC